jgi:hypothetical protein
VGHLGAGGGQCGRGREGADGGAGGVVQASSRSCQTLAYLVARNAVTLVRHCFSGCGNGNRVRFFNLLLQFVCGGQRALAAAFLRIGSVDDMVARGIRDGLCAGHCVAGPIQSTRIWASCTRYSALCHCRSFAAISGVTVAWRSRAIAASRANCLLSCCHELLVCSPRASAP